jgi:hypothetical protein
MCNSKYVIHIFFLITISLLLTGIGGDFNTPVEAQMQPSTTGKLLTNGDIISLTRAGLSDEVIISTIQRSQQNFDLAPEALIALKKSGVSNKVIEAMVGGLPSSGGESTAPLADQPPSPELGEAAVAEAPLPPPSEAGPAQPPPPEMGEAEVAEAPPPPPLGFATPPDVVVVPSGENYVYMVPNTFGVYFFGGFWYRYHSGYWFRASAYNAPWVPLAARAIPRVIIDVPPEYIYSLPPQYHRIHYNEFHRSWRDWDRNRAWHRQDWFRHEMRADIVRDRHRYIEREREKWHSGQGRPPAGFIVHHPPSGIKPPPVVHKPPVVEKPPLVRKPPLVEKPPLVRKPPVVEKPPLVQKPGLVEKPPLVRKPAVVEKAPAVQKSPQPQQQPRKFEAPKKGDQHEQQHGP